MRSIGVNGAEGYINAPTVFNSAYPFRYFWDSREDSLEDQTDGPISNSFEMGIIPMGKVSLFLQDITERKQAAQTLHQLNQELEHRVQDRIAQLEDSRRSAEIVKERAERANRAKSLFLANMSYELRTPLNAILGFTQVITRDPQTAPQHREYLSIVERSGIHLLALLNDVLEMAKIEEGRFTISVH